MTEELSRTSALASRHKELGSGLEDWNGMGTAWQYSSNPEDEHDAVRDSAGMFDMSPLKKVRVAGTDALAVVDHAHSRDLTTVGPGESAYGAVLTADGAVADDAIAFNNGDEGWLVVHGSGQTMEMLADSAAGKDVSLDLDDDLHIISLQGPKSLGLLDEHCTADLSQLRYFNQVDCHVFDRPAMLSRTGYSGERGYEVFVRAADSGHVWDSILDVGASMGVMPASFTALDKVRVEAALLFYGYDMTDEHMPSEVGLGWALSREGSYRGKDSALDAIGKERFVGAGIVVDSDEMLTGGEELRFDGALVGVVNSPAFSHRLNKSLALVHLHPDAAEPGTRLTVVGEAASHTAVAAAIPFFDPTKSRTHQ